MGRKLASQLQYSSSTWASPLKTNPKPVAVIQKSVLEEVRGRLAAAGLPFTIYLVIMCPSASHSGQPGGQQC